MGFSDFLPTPAPKPQKQKPRTLAQLHGKRKQAPPKPQRQKADPVVWRTGEDEFVDVGNAVAWGERDDGADGEVWFVEPVDGGYCLLVMQNGTGDSQTLGSSGKWEDSVRVVFRGGVRQVTRAKPRIFTSVDEAFRAAATHPCPFPPRSW